MAIPEAVVAGRVRLPPSEQQSGLRMINLLKISSDERKTLMARIASCNGALQIWVHTHDDEGMKPDYREDTADLVQYLSNRDKMIKFSYRAKLPILCLIGSNDRKKNENGETLASYANYYAKLNEGSEGVPAVLYYLPTLLDRSCPLIKAKEPDKSSDVYEDFTESNWDLFFKMLKELGVNIVIFRGRNLRWREYYSNAEERDYLKKNSFLNIERGDRMGKKPVACLGSALLALGTRGMDVRLSRVIHRQV